MTHDEYFVKNAKTFRYEKEFGDDEQGDSHGDEEVACLGIEDGEEGEGEERDT